MASRVPTALLERLLEIEGEIADEYWGQMSEDGLVLPHESEETIRKHIDKFKDVLQKLIDGKTHWLEHGSAYGLLTQDGQIQEWYLDYQEELAQIIVARRFVSDLDNTTYRLKLLYTLLLTTRPPIEVRTYLEEAGHTFLYGLFRSTATLSRGALELALEHRLPAPKLQE